VYAPVGDTGLLLLGIPLNTAILMKFAPMGPFMTELYPTNIRGTGRAAKKIWRGTDGSNPSPSSGESGANSTPRLRRPDADRIRHADLPFFRRIAPAGNGS
jgi:hypothetical protein